STSLVTRAWSGQTPRAGRWPGWICLGDQPRTRPYSFADLAKRVGGDHLEGLGKRLVLALPVSRWTTHEREGVHDEARLEAACCARAGGAGNGHGITRGGEDSRS